MEKKSKLKEKTEGKRFMKNFTERKNSKIKQKTSKFKQKPLKTQAKTQKVLNQEHLKSK